MVPTYFPSFFTLLDTVIPTGPLVVYYTSISLRSPHSLESRRVGISLVVGTGVLQGNNKVNVTYLKQNFIVKTMV